MGGLVALQPGGLRLIRRPGAPARVKQAGASRVIPLVPLGPNSN
jgi:hypothetical protein